MELKDFRIEHINTGCLYEKDGQLITIAFAENATHVFDHSRMIDLTIERKLETPIQAVRCYLRDDYTHMNLDWELRREFYNFHKTAEFKDISNQYRNMIIWG